MYKYIKKLTSVVVMFAVIIVFSSSNVYAAEKKQTYNPFLLLYVEALLAQPSKKYLSNDYRGTNPSLAKKFFDLKDKLKNTILANNSFRNGELKLIQPDNKYYPAEYNEKTGKIELTAEGKKNFKAANPPSGNGGGGC